MGGSGSRIVALYVAAGSAIGGVARLFLSDVVQTRASTLFPVGTLAVNILGSFILGFIVRFSADTAAVSPEMRAFLTTGICGGFTTFSTFSRETVGLIEDGEHGQAAMYVFTSVALAIVATLAGFAIARWFVMARRG
jgi:fluoride exporter